VPHIPDRATTLDPAGAASHPPPATELPPPPPPSAGYQVPEAARADERARVAGRLFARTAGVPNVLDDDTRFYMLAARVGHRVLRLHDPHCGGRHMATLTEQLGGHWLVEGTGIGGAAITSRSTFADAVWAGTVAGDLLATPMLDEADPEQHEVERPATLDDLRRAWPDRTDDELRLAQERIHAIGGQISVARRRIE
jgi:hypothetical protein